MFGNAYILLEFEVTSRDPMKNASAGSVDDGSGGVARFSSGLNLAGALGRPGGARG